MMRRLLSLIVCLWIAGASVQAQPRPMAATTLTTTDTGVNSLLVGCAVGSTTCTGGIKSGGLSVNGVGIVASDGRIPAISSTYFASLSGANLTGIVETAITDGSILARVAASETISGNWTYSALGGAILISSTGPLLRFSDSDSTTAERAWQINTDSDIFQLVASSNDFSTSNTVFVVTRTGTTVDTFRVDAAQALAANGTVSLPAWAFTNDPDSGLYRIGAGNIGVSTDGVLRSQWTSTGAFNHAGALLLTGAHSLTSATGDNNNVSLNATALRLDVTTVGGTFNTLTGLTGGSDGRMLMVCHVASSSSSLEISNEDAASTAANRFSAGADFLVDLNQCVQFIYIGSLSRWARFE